MNKHLEKIKNGIGGVQMSQESAEVFAVAVLADLNENNKNEDIKNLTNSGDAKLSFCMKVLKERIIKMKLPIDFSMTGAIAAEALCAGNVGRMVTILIDCLNEYEGQTVTPSMLANLYPMGMYNNSVFEDYVDNYLKPNKVKWAEVF